MEDAERRSIREAALMARLKRHRDNICISLPGPPA